MELSAEYCAGFFDGEGSVYAARRRKKSPIVIVCIGNTHKGILEKHKEKWGGSIHRRVKHNGWQDQYQWVLSTRMAKPYLEAILPFVVIKKEVIIEALKYINIQQLPRQERMEWEVFESTGQKKVRMIRKPEITKKLLDIHEEIRRLNSKSAPYNARRSAGVFI
jgi:hypothetical protein